MNKHVLMPTYMKDFACIGSECEDSCCTGWQVTLDKKSYKEYKNIKHPQLSKSLQQGMKRNKSDATSSANYASFYLDQHGRCPMLNEQNLCGIQLNLGEKMLSPTCKTYPRVVNLVDDTYEMSAKLSCPEVARLVLLNKEKMECEEAEVTLDPSWSMLSVLDTQNPKLAERYFWNIRVFTIDVLQNRNWSIEDRLVFLGLFIQKLEQLLAQNHIEHIPDLIHEYIDKMESPDIQASLDMIKGNVKMQMHIIMHFVSLRAKLGVSSERYVSIFSDMLSGFGLDQGDTIDVDLLEQQYLSNYKMYYEPFMSDHSYMLENYLVNHVFESMFPKSGDSLFSDYMLMAVIYMMVRIHLIGISGHYKGLNEEIVIKVVQSFNRVTMHSSNYLEMIKTYFKENEFDSLAHIVAILSTRVAE
jgi:lysine-N-methylase